MNQKATIIVLALLTVLKVNVCVDFPNIENIEAPVTFLTDCFRYASDLAILKKNLRDQLHFLIESTNKGQSEVFLQAATTKALDAYLDPHTEAFTYKGLEELLKQVNNGDIKLDLGDKFLEKYGMMLTFFDGSHPFLSLLFEEFGILAGRKNDQKAFAKEIITRYRLTPYHNICHGIYVGLGSASAFLIQSGYIIKKGILYSEKDPNKKIEEATEYQVFLSLFLAGVSHDIAHLGLSNATQKNVLADKSRPRFTGLLAASLNFGCVLPDDLSNEQIEAIAHFLGMDLKDKADAPALLVKYSNLALNLINVVHYDEKKRADYEIPDKDFVKNNFKFDDDTVVEADLKKAICSSAEHLQSIAGILMYEKLSLLEKNPLGSIGPGIIARAILGTHMGIPKKAHLHIQQTEKIVHLVDLLNTFPEDPELGAQALRGLMIEFIVEYRDHEGCQFAISAWENNRANKRDITEEELKTQSAEIRKVLNTADYEKLDDKTNIFKKFINFQNGFFNGLVIGDIKSVFGEDFKFALQLQKKGDINAIRIDVLEEVYRSTNFFKEGKMNLTFI